MANAASLLLKALQVELAKWTNRRDDIRPIFGEEGPVALSGRAGFRVEDILVEGRLLLELKACKALEDVHLAQCLNYLKATGIPTCLLINFGTTKPQIRRVSR